MEPSCVHIYRKYFLTEHEVNWMERAENHEWSARGPIKAKFDNAFRPSILSFLRTSTFTLSLALFTF
ncbi:hypothetical protein Naga_100024g12 [Nannochloropsis gaditana]|uniref:Uncharacterized protein n=1 Tax=Nannochloropsis gaditana TaxID=72520 RepID=W7U834_9STRA|nr:hypothetical protein Naga_100024g12 [Nannochloropsis gaditana]